MTEKLVQNKHIYVYKRVIADKATEPFNQALYETDWDEIETRSQKSKLECKSYKNLFETIKKRSKKLHYSKLIIKYKENIKKNMVSN